MVHILHQGFQFYILYNLASLRVRKIRFASLYRNPQIKTFEFRNFRIFSESFRNSKWFAWFPGQITIDRIIIISHDFSMTFSDLLNIWPFFLTWVRRCFCILIGLNVHRIKLHGIRVSLEMYPILHWQIQKLDMSVDFPTFQGFFRLTWCKGVTWWTGDYRLYKQYRTQRMLYNEPQNSN